MLLLPCEGHVVDQPEKQVVFYLLILCSAIVGFFLLRPFSKVML